MTKIHYIKKVGGFLTEIHQELLDFIPKKGIFLYPRDVAFGETYETEYPKKFVISSIKKKGKLFEAYAYELDADIEDFFGDVISEDNRQDIFMFLRDAYALSVRDVVSEMEEEEEADWAKLIERTDKLVKFRLENYGEENEV